jgi:hypothetical protein
MTGRAPDPKEKIKAIVDELDRKEIQSPREGLDMLCVADLGHWSRGTSVLTEKFLKFQNEQVSAVLGKEALVLSAMRHKYDDPQPLAPETKFIGSLWGKLAINDPTLKPLADRLRMTDTYSASGAFAFDPYKLTEVTTPRIADIVRRESLTGPDWMWQY